MKRLIVLLALTSLSAALLSSCTTVTEVAPSEQPSIRGFAYDTVWPGAIGEVFGKNLAFSEVWLGDREVTYLDSTFSNFIHFVVPKDAATDYVYVSTDGSYKARSPKQLIVIPNVKDTSASGGHDSSGSGTQDTTGFAILRLSSDTGVIGKPMAIYGKHLFQKRDSISLQLNGVLVPIDSYTDDSIVFTVPKNATRSALVLMTANQVFRIWYPWFVVPIAWRTCTISIIGVEYTALHRRIGTADHGRYIDSTWQEHTYLNWTKTVAIPDAYALVTSGGRLLILQWQSSISLSGNSSLQLALSDSTSNVMLGIRGHSSVSNASIVTIDTGWTFNVYRSVTLNLNGPSTLTIPFLSLYSPTISTTRTETSNDGEHDWSESTNYSASPSYGVGRITFEFKP